MPSLESLVTEQDIAPDNLPCLISPQNRQRIMDCQRPADWKGEGAAEVSRSACETAIDLINSVLTHHLPEPTSFGPSVHGAVGLTWRNSKFLLFVEVFASTEMPFQLVGKDISRRNGTLDPAQLVTVLEDLYTDQ